jgi:hypothetical protein
VANFVCSDELLTTGYQAYSRCDGRHGVFSQTYLQFLHVRSSHGRKTRPASEHQLARGLLCSFANSLGCAFEQSDGGFPRQEGLKMSEWRIRLQDVDGRDLQSIHPSRETAIIQALHLERRQHARIQIIEGPDGALLDRETFEREHLKRSRS